MASKIPSFRTIDGVKAEWKGIKEKLLHSLRNSGEDLADFCTFFQEVATFYINSSSTKKEDKKFVSDCCSIPFRNQPLDSAATYHVTFLKESIIGSFYANAMQNVSTEACKSLEELFQRFEMVVDRSAELYSGCLGVPLFEMLLADISFIDFVFFYFKDLHRLLMIESAIPSFTSFHIGATFKTMLLIISRSNTSIEFQTKLNNAIIPFFAFESIIAEICGHIGLIYGFMNKDLQFESYLEETKKICEQRRPSVSALIKICTMKGFVVYFEADNFSLKSSGLTISSALIEVCQQMDDPLCKIYAFETLGLWLKRIVEKKENEFTLEISLCDAILQLVVENWEDSVDAVNGKVKMILHNFVILIQKTTIVCSQEYFNKIFHFAISMNQNRRVKYAILSSIMPHCNSAIFKATFFECLEMIENPLIGHRVAELCVAIVKSVPADDNLFWMRDLSRYFISFPDRIHKNISNYFLARVFSLNNDHFFAFVELLKEFPLKNISALVASLNIAKKGNIVSEIDAYLDRKLLEECFTSYYLSLRLNSFALLTSFGSKIAAYPPTNDEVDLFLFFFDKNSQVSSSEFRQNASSSASYFFSKLAYWYFCKSFDILNFMNPFLKFVTHSLNPLACFQRAEFAYMLIENYIDSFYETLRKLLLSDRKDADQLVHMMNSILKNIASQLSQQLIIGLATPYTENRNFCVKILLKIKNFTNQPLLVTKLADELLISTRPAEADAGAKLKVLIWESLSALEAENDAFRMWQFVQETISQGLTSNAKFLQICRETSVCGTMVALSAMVNVHENSEFSQELSMRVFKDVFSLADLVYPVLFHQSPEGCLPFEILDDNDEEDIEDYEILDVESSSSSSSSQQLACFSWRSLKEYCNLIQCLISKISLDNFDTDLYLQLCEKYYEMLLHVKHRGAFLSLYDTFLALCKKAYSHPSLCSYPSIWLKRAVDMLSSIDSTLAFTRRSGGLPYLFLALILSMRSFSKGNHFLGDLISSLVEMFSDEKISRSSKIHILNILRAIFKDSSLGLDCVQFCENVFILTINGFSDADWAIRNGCLMLFSSLMTRIFGPIRTKCEEKSTINQLTFDNFFAKFGFRLLDCVLCELKTATKSVQFDSTLHPSLFPILSMFSRFSPGKCSTRNAEFVFYVQKCFFSGVYQLREIAANALFNIIDPSSIEKFVQEHLFLHIRKFSASNNFIHSSLCLLRTTLKHYAQHEIPMDEIFRFISNLNLVPFNRYLLIRINEEFKIIDCIPIIDYTTSFENPGLEYYKTCLLWKYSSSCFVFLNFEKVSEIPVLDLLHIFNRNCCVFCQEKALKLLKDNVDCIPNSALENLLNCTKDFLKNKDSGVVLKASSLLFLSSVSDDLHSLEDYFLNFSHDENPVCTRECVVDCISAWSSRHPMTVSVADFSPKMSWILVSLLQDDDEDIRNKTAQLLNGLIVVTMPKSDHFFLELILTNISKNENSLCFFLDMYAEHVKKLEAVTSSSKYQKSLFKPEPLNLYREYFTEIAIIFKKISSNHLHKLNTDKLSHMFSFEKDKILIHFLREQINEISISNK